jgi:hypothetical protein
LLPRAILVVPEVAGTHPIVDFRDTSLLACVVKDSLEGERFVSADPDNEHEIPGPWMRFFSFREDKCLFNSVQHGRNFNIQHVQLQMALNLNRGCTPMTYSACLTDSRE